MPDKVECDLQQIIQILGRKITYKLLQGKATETTRKYVKVHVRKNRSGWLWNALMKVFVPFQPVTNLRTGKRRLSVKAWIYMFLMAMASVFLNIYLVGMPSLRIAFFKGLWLVIILIGSMPYVMALIYLQINKQYYKEVIDNGEGFYFN